MSNKYIKNPESWSDIMKAWISTPAIRKNYLRVVIKKTWSEEMGPLITKYTQSLKIRNGILIIKVSSAPLKNDLIMHTDRIVKMINRAVEEELINGIHVE